MLSALPPEIVLNVLSYINIHQIHRLQLVSRTWNSFISTNESTIYRECAVLHLFAKPDIPLCDARGSLHGTWLDDLNSWKDLFQRLFSLEHNWEGAGCQFPQPPIEKYMSHATLGVHRIKVDEEHGLVISTHRRGGLVVSSINHGGMLFKLSSNYVRRRAHVEYASGYVIFDRLDPHSLEVWRLETPSWDGTSIPSDPPNRSRLHPTQIAASQHEIQYRDPSGQGCFSPWAHLCPPTDMRAYRFVYPTLLVASFIGHAMYLFDIPSATLIQSVLLEEHRFFTEPDALLTYVELGARHIFVCTAHGILIVPRSNPTISAVVEFPGDEPHMRIPALAAVAALQVTYSTSFGDQRPPLIRGLIAPPSNPSDTDIVPINELHYFTAVHVSPDGKDFAAITWQGLLFLVKGFERVVRGECVFSDVTVQIQLDGPAMYLAFEYGRVVVKTTLGVCIINWDSSYHDVFTSPRLFAYRPSLLPNLTIHKLGRLIHKRTLDEVNVLQMTKTAVWLNWAPVDDDDGDEDPNEVVRVEPLVCAIDFSPI